MRCTQGTKKKLVAEILENEVYMPESGVVLQLTHALLKMSVNDLGLLKLIIGLKTTGEAK